MRAGRASRWLNGDGNISQKADKATGDYTTYEWDSHNQLVRVELRSSTNVLQQAVEYDYDAMGRLIRRQVDSNGNGTFDSAQKFVYDGTQVVLVFNDGNVVTNRLLWGPQVDQLFADENAVNDVLWTLTDNLGSVRQVVEYDGVNGTTVADTLDYDAFGNVTSESNPSKSPLFKFTGRYFDDVTGLQYNWHRWYDPGAGRWISQDPIGFRGGSMNLSAYVHNAPTGFTDPSGRIDIVILIDPGLEGAPQHLNTERVESMVEDALSKAGINAPVTIRPVNLKDPDEVGEDNLGLSYTQPYGHPTDISGLNNVNWINPLWLINSAGIYGWNTGKYCRRKLGIDKPYAYVAKLYYRPIGYLPGQGTNTMSNIASTNKGSPFSGICERNLMRQFDKARDMNPDANIDIAYTNTILHEVFYLGLGVGYDSGDSGISAAVQNTGTVLTLPPETARQIRDSLGLP